MIRERSVPAVATRPQVGRCRPGARCWSPGWKMTAFVLPVFPLLIWLGLWQLDRAAEKARYEAAYLDRIAALPVSPGDRLEDFQRLRLTGRFEADRYFLLDNQVHGGAVGYGVVASFLAEDGRRWLPNRGFVAGDPGRERGWSRPAPAGPGPP